MGRYAETGAEMVWGLETATSGLARRGQRALVRVLPAHPANAVKAVLSQPGGAADREVRGHAIGLDPVGGAQIFAIDLPRMPPGIVTLWRPVLMRSGRVLDPRLGGQAAEPLPAEPQPPAPGQAPVPAASPVLPTSGPFPLLPVFLFRVTVPVLPDLTPSGETPEGLHLYFELGKGGSVRGPALEAEVLARDGDRLRMRPDGIGVVEVEATLVTRSGDVVVTFYSGLIDTGPDGYAQLLAGTGPRSAPVRFAPRYLTAAPSLMWMNRLQAFGIGQVSLERLLVEYDVYAFGPADLPI